jgi:hypothetical protein
VIKVMIVFYGLVMFVPQGEMNGTAERLTVMFVNGGSHLPDSRHEPRVRAVDGMGNLGPPWTLLESFAIHVAEASGAGSIDLGARGEFAELRPLFTHGDRGSVRSDCMRNEASCRISGDDLVQGTVTVGGEWKARQATYCDRGWKLPIDDYDEAEFEFRRRVSGSKHDEIGEQQLATALVLETDLDKLEELSVSMGDPPVPVPIETLLAGDCSKWIKDHPAKAKCVILIMGSPPAEHGGCRGDECFMDHHFSAYYRTTVDPPMRMNRWRPFVLTHRKCPAPDVMDVTRPAAPQATLAIVHPPAVRCPPPFATPEP